MAALRPRERSEMTSFTPLRPRRPRGKRLDLEGGCFRLARAQPEDLAAAILLTPVAIIAAIDTMRPFWRTLM